jgi:ABC-type uncharacterized transport system substrate-binding protein
MVRPAKYGVWGGLTSAALVAIAMVVTLSGCSGNSTPSLAPKPVKLATPKKIAVIRLGDPARLEPPGSDIADGIKYSGPDASSFALIDRDAKGDLAAVPGLIDAALAEGADLLITLVPETTMNAVAKYPKVPLVFYMNGEPILLGLGKSDTEHSPDLTGAYTPFEASLIVLIARGCLPNGHKLGIPFNPDDRFSVAHKDALLRSTGWGKLEPVTAEFRSESEVPAAIRRLAEQKADGILLVTGVGGAARAAIAEAGKAKLPVFGFRAEHARAGAIVVKEPVMRWGGFEAGRRAGRVLLGESPGQIPFTRGTGSPHDLYVNSGAAKELGVKLFGDLFRSAKIVSTEEPGQSPGQTQPADSSGR